MRKFTSLTKSLLVAAALLVGGASNAWADNYSGSVSFAAQNRITNNNDGTFTTANNTGNQYALALADLSGLDNISSATSVTLEFDVTIPSSGRLMIGIGDKNIRGTNANGSFQSTYNKDGLVMYYGTSDGTYVRVNGGTNNSNLLGTSSHVTFTLNRTTGKYSYIITYVDGESVVQTGLSGSNIETTVSNATIVEAYSWANNQTFAISDVSYSYEYDPSAFDYTINAVDSENNIIKEFASGNSIEAVSYYYPYAFEKDGVYYTTSAVTYKAEATSINPTVNIVYTPDESIVGFYEGETAAGTDAAYSNGGYGTVAAQNKRDRGIAAGTLTSGVYKFMGRLVADGNSGRAITIREGTNDPMASLVGSNSTKDAEAEFTVYATTGNLYINGANSGTEKTNLSTSFDYVLIKRVGDATVPVEVTSAGYATYVPSYDLDFSATSIEAYKVKVNEKGKATLTKVDNVPAGTPVLLYKDGGATENIPVMTGAAAVTDNDLVAGTGATVETIDGEYTNMILNNVGGNIGFYFAAGQTVAANRAYLHFATSLAPEASSRLVMVFGDETTGINDAKRLNNKEEITNIYNLSGQRVAQPTKGLYIVNGKKVIIK